MCLKTIWPEDLNVPVRPALYCPRKMKRILLSECDSFQPEDFCLRGECPDRAQALSQPRSVKDQYLKDHPEHPRQSDPSPDPEIKPLRVRVMSYRLNVNISLA